MATIVSLDQDGEVSNESTYVSCRIKVEGCTRRWSWSWTWSGARNEISERINCGKQDRVWTNARRPSSTQAKQATTSSMKCRIYEQEHLQIRIREGRWRDSSQERGRPALINGHRVQSVAPFSRIHSVYSRLFLGQRPSVFAHDISLFFTNFHTDAVPMRSTGPSVLNHFPFISRLSPRFSRFSALPENPSSLDWIYIGNLCHIDSSPTRPTDKAFLSISYPLWR